MTIIGAIFIYPFIYTIAISLSDAKYILEKSIYLLPKGFTLEAYELILSDKKIWNAFLVTVQITVLGALLNIVMTTLAAYPLSRKNLKGSKPMLVFIVFTMYFSGGIMPTYILIKNLGLTNKLASLYLPIAISPFYMIIMMSYLRGLPPELEEAATIDGCSNVKVFTDIILPLCKPIVATLTLFYAIGHWNVFFNSILYIQDSSKYPLQVLLYQVLSVIGDDILNNSDMADTTVLIPENLKAATVIVTIVPIAMIYPFLQKYFVKGITLGSIKG